MLSNSKHSGNCVGDRNKRNFSACGRPRHQNLPKTIDLDNGDHCFPSFLKSNKKTMFVLWFQKVTCRWKVTNNNENLIFWSQKGSPNRSKSAPKRFQKLFGKKEEPNCQQERKASKKGSLLEPEGSNIRLKSSLFGLLDPPSLFKNH